MDRSLAALALLALALPLAALEPPEAGAAARNPLEWHVVTYEAPALVLEVEGSSVRASWAGRAALVIDGQVAAWINLPGGSAALPRRRWDAWDWLAAGGIAASAAILGAAAGALAQAIR